MIKLTRLDGSKLVVNCDLIEIIEATPDTILTLTTQKRLVVHESVDEIIERAIEYKKHLAARYSSDPAVAPPT
jgi:flagellar protein FlbD